MTTAQPHTEVAAALLVRNGKVLLGLRAAWKPVWASHWDAIGGRLEPGETPEAAMVREVREEIGIRVGTYALLDSVLATDPKTSIVTRCSIFAVFDWTGEPDNLCDEHDEIAWFTPEDIGAIENLAGDGYPQMAARAVQMAG